MREVGLNYGQQYGTRINMMIIMMIGRDMINTSRRVKDIEYPNKEDSLQPLYLKIQSQSVRLIVTLAGLQIYLILFYFNIPDQQENLELCISISSDAI